MNPMRQQNVQKLHLIEIIRRIEVSTEHLSFKSTPFTTFDTSISLWISIVSLGDSIANTLAMISPQKEMVQKMLEPLQITISSFQGQTGSTHISYTT
ncbi:hypothetical protein BOTCAL_0178g00080 [Botryotinia calthae]|uniref:Uncharacterized protein n=1 Tax=Botryotinia calthae TaxID=38488 RepID=A0A4Y8D345_9HELO|nr:hypothetical protein BOTCAL_0178g00080 [Botryotinia calthae]